MTSTAPSAEAAAAAHARRGGESLRSGRAWAVIVIERASERTYNVRTLGGVDAMVHLAGKDCTGVNANEYTARV